jgi:hypothetical protein
MRRVSGLVSVLLLSLLAIAIAEACLAALLLLFSFILNLRLGIELGAAGVLGGRSNAYQPDEVMLFNAAIVASVLFTTVCGLAAATLGFRRSRPAR